MSREGGGRSSGAGAGDRTRAERTRPRSALSRSTSSPARSGSEQYQQQQQQEQHDLHRNYDGSLSEERIIMHNTWGSLDSSGEPQQKQRQQQQQKQQEQQHSQSTSEFRPDRRRQFDSTTPTLVDEDDCEEEILSLEQQVRLRAFEQQQHPSQQQQQRKTITTATGGLSYEDFEIRRTPGATAMHKSFTGGHHEQYHDIGGSGGGGTMAVAGSDGIDQQQQQQQRHHQQRDSSEGSLGYALTLSTPIATAASSSNTVVSGDHHQQQQQHHHHHHQAQYSEGGASIKSSSSDVNRREDGSSREPPGWETYAATAAASVTTGLQQSSTNNQNQEVGDSHTSRPPLVPPAPQAGSSASTADGGDVGGSSMFSFPSTLTEQQQHIQRQGAFSPGLLRLTEDIGNLLQEDEDDDYTIEIPSVFRSEGGGETSASDLHNPTATAPMSADWTNSFIIERNKTFAKRTVTRSAAPLGRNRRGRGSSGSSVFPPQQPQHQPDESAASFLSHAQQPIPRRSGNDVFEFGKSHDERDSSPQLLNFGGAFAPLPKADDYGGTALGASSSLAQPPGAYVPVPAGFSFQQQQPRPPLPGTSFQSSYHDERTPSSSTHLPLPPGPSSTQQPLFNALSFESYQSAGTGSAPTSFHTAPYGFGFTSQSPASMISDMQATAQEFVPMSTRSTTPMLPPQMHQQSHPPPHWSQHQQQQQQQQQQHQHTNTSSASATPTSFVAPGVSSNYRHPTHAGLSYGYGIQQQQQQAPPPRSSSSVSQGDTLRATMTPSPHLPMWHQQPPASLPPTSSQQQQQQQHPGVSISSSPPLSFHVTAGSLVQHPASSRAQASFGIQQPSPTTSSASQAGLASVSPAVDSSQRGPVATSSAKKEAKKGNKRGKKKSSQGSTSTTSASGTGGSKSEATIAVGKKTSTSTGKSKKKQNEQGVRPGSSATQGSHDGQGDDTVSASDELGEQRRTELDESPATRLAFKEFYKEYRAKEQIGVQEAEDFATQSLQDGTLPESIHWRVYVELADLARRSNRFAEARRLYQKVCQIQPYASQGWVEYSKLEEECGNMNRVTNILHAGLEYCEYNENLLIKAVKHQERMGNMDRARALLARLKHIGIDKVWRTMLEGAMLEARSGNIVMARRVLKYIMHHVPWYGPLYVEFYRLERDHGHPLDALDVVQRGLSQIPRYGPLWFSALRVCEQLDFADKNFHMPETTAMLQRASANVNKEITWKVHLEASFIFERAAQEQAIHNNGLPSPFLGPARHFFSLTIRSCRLNLRWKVWLAAARMELCAGNTDKARPLFLRAHQVAPEKVRSLTFLDYARLHEFTGESELARAILCKGRYDYGHDWKVWLESVLLEMRGFNLRKAYELASRALDVHHGTGRLWASLVQLSQYSGGDEAQYKALKSALNAVPKSGEVWCEGARIHLNPFSDVFDLGRARRHLFFAGKFTPQYGDSFLEIVRLELLDQWLAPISNYIWEQTKTGFLKSKKANEPDCLTKYITDVTLAISVASKPVSDSKYVPSLVHGHIVETVRRRLQRDEYEKSVDLSSTILSCSNVDPNYGPLWFNCRRIQTDPPRRVVEHAAECMVADLQKCAHVYLAAMLRRKVIMSTLSAEKPKTDEGDDIEVFDPVVMDWEDRVDEVLRAFPSLRDIFNPVDPTTGLVLLESTLGGSDFVTGLMEFNKYRPINQMSLADRKRAVFATDALFP